MNLYGVIPAYCPPETLESLLRQVTEKHFLRGIVVVDDGSGSQYGPLFSAIADLRGVTVLRHAINEGTGAAIKTAFNFLLCQDSDCGAVTFDADGQHLPEDVRRVAEAFREHPECLVLGVRDFGGTNRDIPWRSRFGNRLTQKVFRLFSGVSLRDTQTGLRAHNSCAMRRALDIRANRYEFQLESLLAEARNGSVLELPITTVYENGNATSHFNPLRDSLRIYFVFLRFTAASLISSLTDYTLFAILHMAGIPLGQALVGARIVSVAVNFMLAREKVFHSRGHRGIQILEYALLAAGLLAGSYGGIRLLGECFGMGALTAKMLVEMTLFIASFSIQKLLIFPDRNA